jgi:hypothetical protein
MLMPDWLLWLLGGLLVLAAVGWGWTRYQPDRHSRGGPAGRRPARPRPRGGAGTTPPRTRGRTTAPPRTRGGTTTAPRPRTGPTTVKPEPGDIWWADVPYEDGTGSKVRPCLVLRVGRGDAQVLKITSQDKSDQADHVRIPTKSWDPNADHDSFLDLSDPIRVARSAFSDRAGGCDPALWRKVRQLHGPRGGR